MSEEKNVVQMKGNTVLVTGGGTGIGRGLAESFHQAGNQVVIAGRRCEPLEIVIDAHPGMGYLLLDQSDAADVTRFVVELLDRYPDLDAVINNAGIQLKEDVTAGEVGKAEQTIATNLLGPIRLTAALLPALLTRPQATIINVSSGLGFMPQAVTPTYCATKAAMHSYTQSLRFQLRNRAVQVIEIIPPMVQTALQGDNGFNPAAMPLDEFITETMGMLQAQPDADEIVVERVKGFRFAERNGKFDEIYTQMNEKVDA